MGHRGKLHLHIKFEMLIVGCTEQYLYDFALKLHYPVLEYVSLDMNFPGTSSSFDVCFLVSNSFDASIVNLIDLTKFP